MTKLYDDLAEWWPLVSAPADYEEEVDFFLPLLVELTSNPPVTLLELGSGGGNNALFMKKEFNEVTLVDLSPKMLEVSRQLNPDCEHLHGDMRTIRLGQTFDVVFLHDAIGYMKTLDELRQALETAFVHCRPGGMALVVPDNVRETFSPSTDHGGEDGNGQAVRYLEWTFFSEANEDLVITDYVLIVREGDQIVKVEHDRHEFGLFALEQWLKLLGEVGFQAEYVIDNFERHVFVARKPMS